MIFFKKRWVEINEDFTRNVASAIEKLPNLIDLTLVFK